MKKRKVKKQKIIRAEGLKGKKAVKMYVSDDRTGQIGNCCRSLKTGGFLYDESFFSKISDVLGNNFFTAYSGWRMSVEISGVSAAADTTGNRGKGFAFSCACEQ